MKTSANETPSPVDAQRPATGTPPPGEASSVSAHARSSYFNTRSCCPVCASVNITTVYSCPLDAEPVAGYIRSHYEGQGVVDWSKLAGVDYALATCTDCDLAFQLHVPNELLLPIIYNEMIESARLASLETKRLTVSNFFDIAGELAHLFQMTGKQPSDITFLDFGFGHGRWARVARALGAKVYVTEFGDDKLEAAAAIGVTVLPDDAIDSMRFDIVHTEQVFEHLVDPAEQFARLSRATKSLFKVAVPRHKAAAALIARTGLPTVSPFGREKDSRKWNWTDRTYVAAQPLEHLNVYSRRTMEILADRNNMEICADIRKVSATVDCTALGSALSGTTRVAANIVKMMFGPRIGYYLFVPRSAASDR